MKYVPLPIKRVETGKPLPVPVWDAKGNLLLRKGQTINSEQHREVLMAHQACLTEGDYRAWIRSYDRMVYNMLRENVSIQQIARATMPDTILDVDYVVGHDITGGWLDLQTVLGGILVQGESAQSPLDRLEGVQKRATSLLDADTDDCLFALFQALAEPSLGYCATHALLVAVACELTARKLDMAAVLRPVLFRAALTMNIGMAVEQNVLARQTVKPDTAQRQLIKDHPGKSAAILRGFGEANHDLLDIVSLHHDRDESRGLARNLECRRVLRMADEFVAGIAARSSRPGLSAIGAAKKTVIGSVGEEARVGAAMTAALGFYPPGTYVRLVNGEIAVSARRGTAANTPLVVTIISAQGVALGTYLARNTREKAFAIHSPVGPDSVKIRVNAGRVFKALQKLPNMV
ncbi:MAG: hypothetical protein IPF71_14230 [Rhodoferax sp.]|nr:hypothetical protein [Rhodoferax sp.]